MTRDEQLNDLTAFVRQSFPRYSITTNKGMNPATPLSLTMKWPNGKTHTTRARSLNINLDQFKAEAVSELQKMDKLITGGIATTA